MVFKQLINCFYLQAIKAEFYWNNGKSPQPLEPTEGVVNYQFTKENGGLLCKIVTEEVLKAGSQRADLSEDQTLLLAGGSYSSGNLNYHNTQKLATSAPVALAQVTRVGGRGDLLFRIHGLLMLTAWLGCAGAGMILARYFKKTWRGKQLMGKDLWFVFHRLLMSLTVLLTIAAVILILVEVQVAPLALESLKLNAHPLIGLICVILAIIQPIMAAFRPHPGTSNRTMFNWAHWLVGNSSHIFAIVALFLAGSLAKTNLSSTTWWSWILMAYIIFHFLAHVILSLVMAKEERSSKVHDSSMSNMDGKYMEMEENSLRETGSGVRKLVLVTYLFVAWAVAISLIIAVFNA